MCAGIRLALSAVLSCSKIGRLFHHRSHLAASQRGIPCRILVLTRNHSASWSFVGSGFLCLGTKRVGQWRSLIEFSREGGAGVSGTSPAYGLAHASPVGQHGLPRSDGRILAVDTTLVSLLRRVGTARCANEGGAALLSGRQRKPRTCPELTGQLDWAGLVGSPWLWTAMVE